MSPLRVAAAFLALSALALPVSTALAQIRPSGVAPINNEGRATGRDDIQHCQAAPGGSRVRENCELETTTVRTEQRINFSIELAPPPTAVQCSATTTTQYQQRNTIARVNSTLEIRDCTAASGAFTVAVRTRDESGADKPLEFSETWQRSDDQPVQVTADYPIGENMELVSVRLRGLICTCADPATEGVAVGEVAATPALPSTEN